MEQNRTEPKCVVDGITNYRCEKFNIDSIESYILLHVYDAYARPLIRTY